MKKNGIYFLMAGSILFAGGIYGILGPNHVLAPALLLLGTIVACIPASTPAHNWREALAASPAVSHEPIPYEPTFIARLFLSMSWVARNCGILALESFMNDKTYANSLYHMGKNMIIDGMDPDFVSEVLGNVIHLIRERTNVKIRYLRQIGTQLCFIGLFVGMAGTFSYGFRHLSGQEISLDGVGILFVITAISLMMSTIFLLLLPCRLKNRSYQIRQTQKQLLSGLLSLQSGESYTAILHKQYTFLSTKEKELLEQEPLFDEARKLNERGNFDGTAADIRNVLKNLAGC